MLEILFCLFLFISQYFPVTVSPHQALRRSGYRLQSWCSTHSYESRSLYMASLHFCVLGLQSMLSRVLLQPSQLRLYTQQTSSGIAGWLPVGSLHTRMGYNNLIKWLLDRSVDTLFIPRSEISCHGSTTQMNHTVKKNSEKKASHSTHIHCDRVGMSSKLWWPPTRITSCAAQQKTSGVRGSRPSRQHPLLHHRRQTVQPNSSSNHWAGLSNWSPHSDRTSAASCWNLWASSVSGAGPTLCSQPSLARHAGALQGICMSEPPQHRPFG